VRVQPGPGDPLAPARSGPEALLRAPDGSTTVGGQHLPQTAPQLPGMPGGPVTGQFPGVLPTPGLPAPGGPVTAPMPAEVPIPLGGLPVPPPAQAPVPLPAEVPVPLPRGMVPQAPGGQFAPPAVAMPGVSR
jgi:hypothetical protein